jgi:putative mycofactocin binding protein MftB
MTSYILDAGCQVRKEWFGLLFYDLRGPRLLFAETGALLQPEPLRSGLVLERELADRSPAERKTVERFLQSLVTKGFVREQPIC